MNGLNTGKYTWCINDVQLIRSMKSATVAEKCTSPIFEMAGIKWVISLLPNGISEKFKGIAYIQLKPLLSEDWEKLIFVRSMNCTEDCINDCWLSSLSNGDEARTNTSFSTTELSQQKTITINVSVNIIKIITKQSSNIMSRYQLQTKPLFPIHHKFTYVIEAEILQKLKQLPHKEYTHSPFFENMWCIELYPNGCKGAEGFVSYYLCCFNFYHLPLKIRYKITCADVGVDDRGLTGVFSESNKYKGYKRWFEKSKLAKCKSLTIEVNLTILWVVEEEQNEEKHERQKELNLHEISDELQISSILSQHQAKNVQKELKSVMLQGESKQDDGKQFEATTDKIKSLSSTMQQIQSKSDQLIQKMNSMNKHMTEYAQKNKELHQELANAKLTNNGLAQNIELLKQKQETTDVSMKKKYDELETQMRKLLSNQPGNDEIKEESDEEKVRKWLENLKLVQYLNLFIKQGFDDMDSIRELTMQDLNDINIDKLGHKKKIMRAVQILNNKQQSQNVAPQYQQQKPPPAYIAQNNNIVSKSAWKCSNCQWKNVPHVRLCAQCGVKKVEYIGIEGANVQDTV